LLDAVNLVKELAAIEPELTRAKLPIRAVQKVELKKLVRERVLAERAARNEHEVGGELFLPEAVRVRLAPGRSDRRVRARLRDMPASFDGVFELREASAEDRPENAIARRRLAIATGAKPKPVTERTALRGECERLRSCPDQSDALTITMNTRMQTRSASALSLPFGGSITS
jgi:hypothetical protein